MADTLTSSPHDRPRVEQNKPTIAESKEVNDEQEEEHPEYPSSWKLGLIITGLCLSIFCLALVSVLSP